MTAAAAEATRITILTHCAIDDHRRYSDSLSWSNKPSGSSTDAQPWFYLRLWPIALSGCARGHMVAAGPRSFRDQRGADAHPRTCPSCGSESKNRYDRFASSRIGIDSQLRRWVVLFYIEFLRTFPYCKSNCGEFSCDAHSCDRNSHVASLQLLPVRLEGFTLDGLLHCPLKHRL